MSIRPEYTPNTILSEQWLDLLDRLNIGAFTVDLRHRITAMNFSAKALMGLKGNDVEGLDCRDVFLGVPCHSQCLLKNGNRAETDDPHVEVTDQEDTRHLITRLASPVFDPAGNAAGCLTVLQDHSPIADLVNRVHYEARSLKIILDNLDIGVFTVNRGGLITFFNTAAEKITGYTRTQLLGTSYGSILKDESAQDPHLLNQSMADGRTRTNHQGRMIVSDGVTIPILANFLALRNEKDTIMGGLVTFNDLTLVQRLNQVIHDRYTFHDMLGKDPSMQKIFEMVRIVAPSDATVLIEGATGTGKDLLAKVIHSAGNRTDKPFVKVNCAALPDNLLESEMFGYVKGAFTGADRDKPGRFQDADGGTIFLDEIGDLPLSLQAKLLRVIEDKEFYPLGGRQTQRVDVRIISASNRGLEKLVSAKQFREDLFYRLNVMRIELPPIKHRRGDLPILIRHILRRLCAARGSHPQGISENAMEILLNHDYQGNVRELENILEHALILSQYGAIETRHLPDYSQQRSHLLRDGSPDDRPSPSDFDHPEREIILATLEKHQWHRGKTATALDIERTTLWRKMKKFGLLP
jgi:PAS domain S-box-containing protein